ncbi:chitin synthase-domain-containing protein [Boletus reticuloceps]|uniref:chitin synthase n=1 Tax=Boletus reticuloceps TaxID=495285 RepID=A0A8I3A6C9_9AGAM|nr:chitin synthase-domain-containing protein [Boletus reticuloceps]
MKREDVRQAWREKFALNVIIWFICACAVFVIAVLGVVICPTEHVFNTSELASHSYSNSVNNVYAAIRGEVFDLTQVASTRQRVVSIIPTKSILQYGGQDATNLFPVQVSALCNGVSGSVSPWVQLSAANTMDLNAQYHDFCVEISTMVNTSGRAIGIYDGLIYDLTEYVNFGPSVQGPHGEVTPSADSQFMDSTLVNLFKYSSGQDLTKAINNLNIGSGTLAAQKMCLRNLFLIGMVDSRNSPQCLFSQYILLALSVMMVSIIAFRFIASINFGQQANGEIAPRQLRKTGLANGHDALLEQGTAVHFNLSMNPLELEIYHQIKNMIGVNPTFYEYLFTIDADTMVDPYSLNRLISAMVHDKKVLGVCGETMLSNAKQSVITMMQVYEYFISHHMAKAFESLFGSVTCLPGCFTLFCLHTPNTQKPLLISDYSQNLCRHSAHEEPVVPRRRSLFDNTPTETLPDAQDAILLSQWRRWINSTIHNLGEFMSLDQLYGFCCFSMRFVVMVDLVSTLIQPITCGLHRLLDCFGCRSRKDYSCDLSHHDWCCVWSPSSRICPSTQMGHGWVDGVLHYRHSDLLVLAPDLLLLAHG